MKGVTTFGAFTTARLGIYAAQKALDITGHNISNINTVGYTRQVVDQFSLRTGGNDAIATLPTGSGVLVSSISQLRDPYLDIRFRTENASVGAMDAKLSGLEGLSKIIDEVAKGEGENGLLLGQISDMLSKLETLQGDQATADEALNAVRSSAETLTRLLHDYSIQMDAAQEDQERYLQQDVKTVNDILTQLQTLNGNIQKSELYGDKALELRDNRNVLLDELSQYIKIDVTYEPVSVGAGKTVDKLVVKTAGKPQKTLVDGSYAGQLSLGDKPLENPNYDPAAPIAGANRPYLKADGTPTANEALAATKEYALSLSELTNPLGEVMADSGTDSGLSEALTFGDTELYGSLQSIRETLTKAGEFSTKGAAAADPDAGIKRGIPYYRNRLDAMARKFAEVMNAANTGYMRNSEGHYVDGTTGEAIKFTLEDGGTGPLAYTSTLTLAQQEQLEEHGKKLGGILFSNSGNGDSTTDADGNANITAGNISISKSWSNGTVKVQNSMVMAADSGSDPQVGTTDNDNILHIILAIQGNQTYLPSDMIGTDNAFSTDPYFQRGFEDFLTDMQSILGLDIKSTTAMLNNYASNATQLDVSRESVAGVELNDEAMSMMQYQKSYAAACRMMTTIDEVLDKLINGTGVVGR